MCDCWWVRKAQATCVMEPSYNQIKGSLNVPLLSYFRKCRNYQDTEYHYACGIIGYLGKVFLMDYGYDSENS